ncbi:MAG: hypothetical protein ACYCX0_10575 [Desulfurivibrionaceae bacterium]|jgi:hypothetical protein|nr:hypothetical protein [Desulfurivibrionaceae bacterium]MDP2756786.1 hypothetical protein [Desulfurivibrionaceae bacterium]
MKLIILIIGLAGLVSGCAYNVQPVSTKAINIYSSYESKVPGQFAVVLDDSIRNVNREVKPVSHVCSAHSYPIFLGESIAVSVKHTLDSVFEQTVEQSTMPSTEAMKKLGLRGVVFVKMDDFSPRLSCSMGFWSGTCSGSTDISFGVNIRGTNGTLLATSVSGSKTFDGDSGGGCGGGANVLSESITRATRDALERLAERVSNSPRLRPNDSQ